MLNPGDTAPPFDLPCSVEDRIDRIALAKIRTEMVVLFFYPRDFSFICPTEVTGFNQERQQFADENATLIGASVDSAESHLRWARELGGIGYPLLADEGGAVARAYGVYEEKERVAMRATFILDGDRKIVYALASPINVGRSVSETLRVVRAIRTGQLCPAEWKPGTKFGPSDRHF
ncbi:MAG TPA: redoxin domain-containing protein [Candidatus Binataceae bacterium]|nr:redoxin domain-containing protein [Candidatus Binataceae bacterium]